MNRLQRLRQFFVDVASELRKTSWPSRKEVYGTTAVVIVTVLLCSVYLFLVDTIIGNAVEFIFRSLNG